MYTIFTVISMEETLWLYIRETFQKNYECKLGKSVYSERSVRQYETHNLQKEEFKLAH